MGDERRRSERRTDSDRRDNPSARADVSRIEHENLYNQVMENVRALRRLESELAQIRSVLEQRERDRFKDAS
jgi:hypothetical protein